MKLELDNLRELSKKVRTEGVKEGIDKLGGLFNLLLGNRKEKKAASAIPTPPQPLTDVSVPLSHDLTTELISAIREATSANRESATVVIEALGQIRNEANRFGANSQRANTETDASPWSEVVKRDKRIKRNVISEEQLKDKIPSAPKVSRTRPAALIINLNSPGDFPELAGRLRKGMNKDLVGDAITGL